MFDFLKRDDINSAVEEYKKTEGAILLDVREKDEYANGHIPGSINVPVGEIDRVKDEITDDSTPVFVYCLAGTRAKRAVDAMTKMGYSNARNIGGIKAYTGEKVTGR